MTKRKKIVIGSVLGASVLGLASIGIASNNEKGTSIRSEVVAERELVSVVTASGYIQPKRKVDISADLSGRVIQLAVEDGQWVERGDLLLRIDPTSFQANARRAEAGVAHARAQSAQARANWLQAQSAARRAEQLSEGRENLISPADLEQARTQMAVTEAQHEAARFQVAQAEAALSEARETLRKTTITAPMSGRVTRLNIQEGETAIVGTMNNPGSLLLTVADLSEMEARVKVDETDVPHISFGDSTTVRIDAFPNQTFVGRVTRISNSAINAATATAQQQQQSVDFEVVVTLSNPPEQLRPDLSATADIVTAVRPNALSVPILALTVRDADGKKFRADEAMRNPNAAETGDERRARAAEVEGVFVIREGKAHFLPGEVGIAGDRYFEVKKGLTAGDVVAAGPYQVVRDLEAGDAVRVETPDANTRAGRGGTAGRGQ
ncbi:efflux RND transporter periplasmic adaptor subunit [soil metagenome]